MGNIHIPILSYADDITIITNNEKNMTILLSLLYIHCNNWRLVINQEKSKIMIFGKKKDTSSLFYIGKNIIEETKTFKYLGITITNNMKFNLHKDRIIRKTRNKMNSILSIIETGKIWNIKTSIIMWKSLVRPLLEYGCEI